MASPPGGCMSAKQFSNYVHERVRECILSFMSKEQTAIHLRDRYQIVYGITELAWCNIEKSNPEFFRTYFEDGVPNAKARAKLAKEATLSQIKEETGSWKTPNSAPKGDSDKAPSLFSDTRGRDKEQQLTETARNVLSQVPLEAANAQVEQSSIKAGQSQALEKQTLQGSQQQPVYPTAEFWQKLLTTLGRIQSNTDQMVMLMTDGHGFAAPHPSAAGSFKRQRVETEKERCGTEEAGKLQDQNIQLPQQTHEKTRGNHGFKDTLDD